jgi:hypothetical protein
MRRKLGEWRPEEKRFLLKRVENRRVPKLKTSEL